MRLADDFLLRVFDLSESAYRGYFVPIIRYCDKLRFLLSTELLLDACLSPTEWSRPFHYVLLNAAYQPFGYFELTVVQI